MQSDQARIVHHDPGPPPGGQEARLDQATGVAADDGLQSLDQGGFEQLYALIQKQMKIQEKEAFKQEQRWRSVQVRLNMFQEEMDAGRREADRRLEQGSPEERDLLGEHLPQRESSTPNSSLHAPSQTRAWSGGTIPKFEDGDDIEQYLTTFERLATAYSWPKEEWAVYLVPHLSGKARGAYVAMDMGDSMDYDNVKEAILAKYEINEEMYRQRFREPDIRPGETPRELYNRLKDLYRKWVKPSRKTVEEIEEILILEQYLRTLSPEVRVWVKEHNPKTGQKAAELVEAFIAARRGPKVFRYDKSHRQPTTRGYSPFELLYGRQVRGPLDVLRDAWEKGSDPQPIPVLQYVLEMREKMEEMAKLVHDNMEKAQKQLLAIVPPDVFLDKPGYTSLVEHNIVLKDPTPVRQRMYRVPEKLLTALKAELEVMKSLGVIERSQSEWSSPIVLVLKKDGSIRFCIDFRKVNSQSNFDAYPTPRLDDLIERIGQAQYISTLDLCRGYWQVPLAPEARQYTAFRTPQGLFQFTVMPFGLHGAPATFQRLMDQVLAGAEAFAAAYLDDIVVYSMTWEDHLQHLREILQRLHQAGLTAQPKKCSIAQTEAKYLGYLLGHGEIRPQQDKVQAVKNCPRPCTKTQLKSFLGLAGWYRRFVPHFATRAASLTDLTRKSSPNQLPWEERHEKAFMDLKEALCNDPVLQSPDFNRPFTVQTDASGVGLGAVLLQGEGDDQKPVAYVSRKLWPRETRYSAVELECLAIKWALETFKYYLLGRDFILQTDHRGL
ncbi:uncharacterized protein [Trachinotus anak]|uniref:uncharacterized protein n=1 Tax=Trachinotus anak TaxID=443729 RepID=UPI0039F19EF8